MNTYTKEDIANLEYSLKMMKEGYDEVSLSDLTQEILDELKVLHREIVKVFKEEQGEDYIPYNMPLIGDASINFLNDFFKELLTASEGLVIIAKSRRA
jgi:hypothetical protein